MTILQGTMQDGTVLPVQVDAQGRLVAEGLEGPAGPTGPAGPAGPAGATQWTESGGNVYRTTGRVGIGTLSPGSPLAIESNAGNQVKITYPAIASYFLNATSGGDFAINKDGTERARIDSSGRLLVGTSTATGDQLLIVQGYAGLSAGNAELGLRRGGNPSVADQGLGAISFQNNSGNTGVRIEAVSSGSWASGSNHQSYLTFSTTADGSSSPAERCRIDSSGRLLVGTSTAAGSSLLQVNGKASAHSLKLRSPDGSWWDVGVSDAGTLTVTRAALLKK